MGKKGQIAWNKGIKGSGSRKFNWRGTPEERFWKFIKKGKNENDCWEWIGSHNSDGYGTFRGFLKNISAHRFSYELHFGKIPEGMKVLHRCDNPPCSNPKHLFCGTQKDNMEDMVRKGRSYDRSGKKNGRAKLTDKKVKDIRELSKRGYSQRRLSQVFKVGRSQIFRIIHNQQWKEHSLWTFRSSLY